MKVPWYRLPTFLALFKLFGFREELRRDNLHNTQPDLSAEPDPDEPLPPSTPRQRRARTADGTHNDLDVPEMGKAGARFGRNVPLEDTFPDEENLLIPNPRTVSNKLLARKKFVPATKLNLLAAAWIQFEVHDWVSHGENEADNPHKVEIEDDDDWPSTKPMEIRRTRRDPTRKPGEEQLPPTYTNLQTHWWDASQIYGRSDELQKKLRSGEDGKLSVLPNGLLPLDPDKGVDMTGVNGNWWVGLGLLHTLFVLEHNAIAEALKEQFPDWSDTRLFDQARLVNAALIAKIHTVEWTPAILWNPRMKVAMEGNWWGLSGKEPFLPLFEQWDVWSGVPGSATDHHDVPYAFTEEFVSVYRLHPLIPDELSFFSAADGHALQDRQRLAFRELFDRNARTLLEKVSMDDVFYTFGVNHPGAVMLDNYPNELRGLRRPDGRILDLAAIDVLRDRERGVPRYNRFRELLRMPRAESFEDLTPNKEWAKRLEEVYGDVDMVDTMVGMYAEKAPDGFGFSETAFRIFLLMAVRRLKSDRFYTVDYRPEVYTKLGMDWVEHSTLVDVLLRHFPGLASSLDGVENAFHPWKTI